MSTQTALDLTRRQRKERTRQQILDAALLLSAEGGLSAVSLRQVTREVGIAPTAFYRHFESVEDLGLVLVDQAFVALRAMLRDVRRDPVIGDMVVRSVDVLDRHVGRNAEQFAFIARERRAGPRRVRTAIRYELDLCERELATDIARVDGTQSWTSEDLTLLSELIVTTLNEIVPELVGQPTSSREAIKRRARKKLLMIIVGAQHWESQDDR